MVVGTVGGDELKSSQASKKSAIGGGEANNHAPAGKPDESGGLGILVVRSRVPVVTGRRIPCCPASLNSHLPAQTHYGYVLKTARARCFLDTFTASSLDQGKVTVIMIRIRRPHRHGV